ncbi:hypothetical protein CPB83DRAFT_888166 [Crepidotus variabilis]|uniref:GST N-terminal domain-containing protein n=1 Tax=Crepidotus variabilis TaxID=179855 RepID=A0A9P6EV54_9AGAR|nr:hypothetical protein CPB83DRAFT_888166 [Crepidotus variabilis]
MPDLPKAALYYSPISVWSAVVQIAVEEKGYSPDELDFRIVDLAKGENFDPTFLRINPKATVPTLVVPYENALTEADDSRYKALTETKTIIEFLDKSRSALSHTHSTSTAPAPALTPATIAGANICKTIIDEVLHSNEANPNTLRYVNARDDATLRALAKDTLPNLLERQKALSSYLSQSEKGEIKVSDKVKKLWLEKLDATNVMVTVLVDAEKKVEELDEKAQANRIAFFKTAKQAWETNLGGMLTLLSKTMVGPFACGDQFSTADLHLTGWFTRIVKLVGGTASDDGNAVVKKLEDHIGGGFKLTKEHLTEQPRRDTPKPDKQARLAVFWDAVKERRSWKKIYMDGLY